MWRYQKLKADCKMVEAVCVGNNKDEDNSQ